MSKICISSCVNDVKDPVRANYVNLYKWPEHDSELMRSAGDRGGALPRIREVGSILCRRMYLRSYMLARKKDTVPEETMKCFARVKERVAGGVRRTAEEEALRRRRRRRMMRRRKGLRRRAVVVGRVKRFSCAALRAVFRRLLFCSASVDVVNPVVV